MCVPRNTSTKEHSTVWVPASATMLLVLLLAAACHCSLPTPDPSTDPAMAKHLQKMWDGCAVTCPNVNLYSPNKSSFNLR